MEVGSGLLAMLGGEVQLSNSVKLLTENYLFPYEEHTYLYDAGTGTYEERWETRYEPVFSGGIRFFGQQLAADLALFTSPDLFGNGEGFPFIPWLGFAYNW